MEWQGDTRKVSDEESAQLFSAGILYLSNGAFSYAYACFERISHKDFNLLFNKALCYFGAAGYEECYRLLCDAEWLLPGGMPSCPAELSDALLCWEYDSNPLLCPMPQQGMLPSVAVVQLLRLKAETAFKLRLYGEVKSISARLGGKYKHINELIKQME